MLRTTPETVSEAIRTRGLPAVRVGRAYVLVTEDVIAWLRTQYPTSSQWAATPQRPHSERCATACRRTSHDLSAALAPTKKPRR